MRWSCTSSGVPLKRGVRLEGGKRHMRLSAWRRSWIMGLWLGAIALAVAVVRFGDSLRPTHGDATGFYVGSLFVWIMWIPWI